MAAKIRGFLFDAYGTVVGVRERLLRRQVPRILGVPPRRWASLVRSDILTRSFADRAALARFILESLRPDAPELEEPLLRMMERELASVEAADGIVSVLAFLERRGYRLGLASNLSSAHKEPLERLDLLRFFSAHLFSCDLGFSKPDPRVYREACGRLDLAPEELLVVGDNALCDYLAPRSLGLPALHLGGEGAGALAKVADVGWVAVSEGELGTSLLTGTGPLELGGVRGRLGPVEPLEDSEQGRYNLVARALFEPQEGQSPPTPVYCKRFLHPEAAHVEELANRLYATVGLPSCSAAVTRGPEPCLVASSAPGVKLSGPTTPELAFEIGRHAAMAYVFANGDLRPHNAVVDLSNGRPSITMIDLEHFLFNLALDLEGLERPLRPQTLDALTDAEWAGRVKRRVLTSWTTRRARRAFFHVEGPDCPLARAFKEGWIAMYREIQANGDPACAAIERRIYQEPWLVIGTRAYRRPMARRDLEDIQRRLGQDPEETYVVAFETEGPPRPF